MNLKENELEGRMTLKKKEFEGRINQVRVLIFLVVVGLVLSESLQRQREDRHLAFAP